MNLYDINEQLQNAVEFCVDENGEILEGQLLFDKISELEMALDDKMENIACYIKNLASDVEALKTEKKSIDARIKSKNNKIDHLKNYLSMFMQFNNIPKFETPKCVVSFRKSQSVEIVDMDKIPQEYVTTNVEVKPDKAELKKFLKRECEGLSAEEVANKYGCYVSENKNIGIK